ncbi:hypothetical protein E4179_21655 [Citrobacter freundii]|nr:hypothetical protein [Citrobacter freundii]QGJ42749.1 hypothetical protein E4179_21655 [Citrobacter freundii]QGJ44741.1 hypothetical protein E4177_03275 [Citrobacter freundii]QGJ52260.1 hypothetical protein E4174_15715 [Citrobacter freundii]RVR64059.1 hypothetical protein EOL25_01300 [Citrobacter freundii]
MSFVTVNGSDFLLNLCRPDKTITLPSGNVPGSAALAGPASHCPVRLTSSQALLYAFLYLF